MCKNMQRLLFFGQDTREQRGLYLNYEAANQKTAKIYRNVTAHNLPSQNDDVHLERTSRFGNETPVATVTEGIPADSHLITMRRMLIALGAVFATLLLTRLKPGFFNFQELTTEQLFYNQCIIYIMSSFFTMMARDKLIHCKKFAEVALDIGIKLMRDAVENMSYVTLKITPKITKAIVMIMTCLSVVNVDTRTEAAFADGYVDDFNKYCYANINGIPSGLSGDTIMEYTKMALYPFALFVPSLVLLFVIVVGMTMDAPGIGCSGDTGASAILARSRNKRRAKDKKVWLSSPWTGVIISSICLFLFLMMMLAFARSQHWIALGLIASSTPILLMIFARLSVANAAARTELGINAFSNEHMGDFNNSCFLSGSISEENMGDFNVLGIKNELPPVIEDKVGACSAETSYEGMSCKL